MKRAREEDKPVRNATYFIFGHYPGDPVLGYFFTPTTDLGHRAIEYLLGESGDLDIRGGINWMIRLFEDHNELVDRELLQEKIDICLRLQTVMPGLTVESKLGKVTQWSKDTRIAGIPIAIDFEY